MDDLIKHGLEVEKEEELLVRAREISRALRKQLEKLLSKGKPDISAEEKRPTKTVQDR